MQMHIHLHGPHGQAKVLCGSGDKQRLLSISDANISRLEPSGDRSKALHLANKQANPFIWSI